MKRPASISLSDLSPKVREQAGAQIFKQLHAQSYEIEEDFQKVAAQYLDMVLDPDVVWSAIGHGGGGKGRGGRLKAMGLKPGLGDILISWGIEIEGYGVPEVLWIECKSRTGSQADEQKKFQQRVERIGHKYEVCKTINDIEYALKSHYVPLRDVTIAK